MKTITKQIEAYTFNELSYSAKQNVFNWLNQYPDYNPNDDDGLLDNEVLHIKKYRIGTWDNNPIECTFDSIEFNFDSLITELCDSSRDLHNLKRYARAYSYYADIESIFRIVKNHNYRTIRLDIVADSPCRERTRRLDSLVEKYREKLENHLRHCEYLAAKAINAEIEYRYSDDYAADTCEANGYLFDVDGNII